MSINTQITQIQKLINEETLRSNRKPESVLLLAVSKQQPVSAILEAYQYGISDFGENYFQEAEEKLEALKHLPLIWHFIGPIQSNKTKGIAAKFDWVHSIDRLKIAKLLNDYRPDHLTPLKVCIQVNLLKENTKSGVAPQNVSELAFAVSKLPHLELKGLMTIPPPLTNTEDQYQVFTQLNQLMHSLNKELGLKLDTLSMGMSDDLISAIRAGATIVRIGRAIFGERQGKSV